jgi:sodium transport system permease protein
MVLVLFRNELRMILRDKRSVMASIVLPILLMPLMLFSSSLMQQKRESELRSTTYRYVLGGPEATAVRELISKTEARMQKAAATNDSSLLRLEEAASQTPWSDLTNGKIHFVIEGARASPATENSAFTGRSPELQVKIAFRADRDDASAGFHRIDRALRQTRSELQDELLQSRGFNLKVQEFGVLETKNVARPGHVAGLTLGRMITVLLLFFMMMAGAMVATDLIAGEKERGTLETLLTSGATRVEIVTAKQLVIMAVTLTITCIQALNLLIYVGLRIIPVPANLAQAAPPHIALLLLLLFLPVTGLISSVLLLTSGFAKTYKEAQMYFTPVFLVGLAPALVPMLPDLTLRSAIVLVPIANIAMAAKEILTGVFDWPMIALAWGVTGGAAAAAMKITIRSLSSERLIMANDSDPVHGLAGLPLFERRVLRWFALLWALLLIVSSYMERLDVRAQAFLNIFVIFFGASILIIRMYKLPPREVFALRLPKATAWLAVVAAAPCGILAGTGLFLLANKLFPVPAEIIESFSSQVAPSNVPLWQIFFFLAVLPGICEELTFRGVLLHGLHRRLRPWQLVCVVGLIFGVFHMALFRLAPTAFLGILLTAVTLLTGSILPAIVWHIASNTLALTAGLNGYPISDLPEGWFVFGAGGLLCIFWVLWRNRTPYPGLRASAPNAPRNAPGSG